MKRRGRYAFLMALPVVGLTGGIASGKSTAGRVFQELGVPLVDADQLAREVVLPGSDGLKHIVQVFGAGVLHEDGTLNRKALANMVFADASLRDKLNAITHPRIAMLAAEKMRALQALDVPYVMYEAALIVENGMYKAMNALVVVAADADTQLNRLIKRDQMSDAEAKARIASQASLEKKLAVADFVIHNDGTEETLRERVRDVHGALLERVKR